MTLACFGDIHFEKLGNKIPNFNQLVSKSVRSSIDTSLDRGATTIALLGDIFNTPYPSQDAIVTFLDILTDYPDVHFICLLGNHDYADLLINSLKIVAWSNKIQKNIEVISKPDIRKIGGVTYHLQPHPFCDPMSKKADFALGHFAVNGARGDNGFTVRTKNQPKGNWILGDFHTEQQGKVKGCRYDYLGSITQLSWEEKPKKSFIVIEDGEKVRHRVDLSYKLIKYVLSSDEDLNSKSFEKGSYYYIQTKNGYLLPKGWLVDHPMVIRQQAVGAKKDKRASVLTPHELMISPLSFLEQYLSSKKVAPDLVTKAVNIAQKIKVST